MSRVARRIWIAAAAAVAAAVLVPAHAQSAACSRFSIDSLSVGSSLGAVRTRFGREGVVTHLVREGLPEASSVEYVLGDHTIYIEYDRRIDRRSDAKVALLRTSIVPTEDTVKTLIRRFGSPVAGGTAGGGTNDTVVWIDDACGIAATIYRRAGSWWSGDVGTFLQLDAMEAVKQGVSPASPYLASAKAAPRPGPSPAGQGTGQAATADAAPATATTTAGAGKPAVEVVPPASAPVEKIQPPPKAVELPPPATTVDKTTPKPKSEPPPPIQAAFQVAPPVEGDGVKAIEVPPPDAAVDAAQGARAAGPPKTASRAKPASDTVPAPEFAAPYAGAVDRLPERIAAAPPVYPANLRLMGVRGRVLLAVTVRADGSVGDVRVKQAEPAGRGFESAATSAVKRWRYKPATLRSVPTEAEIEVAIEFK